QVTSTSSVPSTASRKRERARRHSESTRSTRIAGRAGKAFRAPSSATVRLQLQARTLVSNFAGSALVLVDRTRAPIRLAECEARSLCSGFHRILSAILAALPDGPHRNVGKPCLAPRRFADTRTGAPLLQRPIALRVPRLGLRIRHLALRVCGNGGRPCPVAFLARAGPLLHRPSRFGRLNWRIWRTPLGGRRDVGRLADPRLLGRFVEQADRAALRKAAEQAFGDRRRMFVVLYVD